MAATLTRPRRSLGSDLRALLAVAHKEWLIFRRYPSWIAAFIIWPVLMPLGYVFTARALGGPDAEALPAFAALAGTTDYASFVIIGVLLWGWLNITLWDVGYQLRSEQMRGTLEANWVCPVWRITIVLGGALTKLATSLFFLVLGVIEFWLLFGIQVVRGNIGLLLLVFLLTIPSIYGLGIAFASLVIRFKEANALVFLVRGIFMIFCGITAPLAVLPGWMQAVAAWLPLTYAIHGIRAAALTNVSLAELALDLAALAGFAVGLPALGYGLFALAIRRARRTGSLAHF